jgi:protein phosphatase
MTEENNNLVAAAVSDRGLSDKRPLNEDSFLCDLHRRLFAVADGVGGAQAGEVASQTAMEVLDEAFRHHLPETDNEDLMELAIQRANNSIHSMARDSPKLARMATTIVALHLDGNLATIGHVGDSRLYRLSPGGKLFRETRDHSVVEEEVRAGRMTPEQAQTHPSRNVISRALGAEETVEVDMKTLEIVPGTAFLLCSDGITRHIPDDELRTHLISQNEPEAICAEMKRICFERGAEDNLTAVVVRLQGPTEYGADGADDERTISTPRLAATTRLNDGDTSELDARETVMTKTGELEAAIPAEVTPEPVVAPVSVPAPGAAPAAIFANDSGATSPAAPKKRGFFGRLFRFLLWLIFIAVVGALAFFGGLYFQTKRPDNHILPSILVNQPSESPVSLAPKNAPPAPNTLEARRIDVDRDPAGSVTKLTAQNPLANPDATVPYLYGRDLLLTGKYDEAAAAFKQVGVLVGGGNDPNHLKLDAAFSEVAAASKSPNPNALAPALADLNKALGLPAPGATPGGVSPSAPPAPAGGPGVGANPRQ